MEPIAGEWRFGASFGIASGPQTRSSPALLVLTTLAALDFSGGPKWEDIMHGCPYGDTSQDRDPFTVTVIVAVVSAAKSTSS